MDSLFYALYYNNSNPLSFDSLVVTPWNALAYNSQVSNLQEHGLHPRWTHGIVNMFLLYGPLTAIAYWKIISHSWKDGTKQEEEEKDALSKRTSTLCCYILVSGLGFLSLAPHQEPRFLLPLLVPLVLLANQKIFRKRALIVVWLVFNAILLWLFGVLHQSGIVKSLLRAGSTLADQTPSALIYYHTYMPPSFLLRPQPSEEHRCRPVENDEEQIFQQRGTYGILEDLNGSDLQTLINSLESHLSCAQQSSTAERYILLVMPPLVQNDKDNTLWSFTTERCTIPGHDCQLLWSHKNHLSTEDLPSFDGSLQNFYNGLVLNVFNITCDHNIAQRRL
jgi:phosphatidylinositol glycan class Z